jgi:flagellar hook-associated protein 2
MSSGLDTESIVKAMLTTEQTRIDKQAQTTTKLGWKQDALKEINSLIKSFRSTNLSVLNSGSNMLSAATYNAFTATMLTTTSAVSVSAGASATAGKVTINEISKLATAATLKSTNNAFAGTSMNTSTTLADLELTNALEFEDGKISFSINGQTFTFSEDTTLSGMMSTINSNSEAGVKMTYSSLTKGFSIVSKATGSSSKVEIENLAGNAFAETDAAFGIAAQTKAGQDAELKIDGQDVVKSSNTFTIDGITYTLNDEADTAISFNVQQDVDGTVKKITSFIDAYNSLITTLQDKIEEKTYRTYTPLTDTQKDGMDESEIKLWEEKAKSGLLKNDSAVSSLLSSMRSAFYTAVESAGISASEIGLTTGIYSDGGKITVDESKLRTALQNNPDAVTNLFTASSISADKSQAFKESGLVTRISNALLSYTSSATNNTLAALEKKISDSEDMKSTLQDRFDVRQEALYARFTAMESALATLNSQSSWLSSLFTSSSS